MKRYSTVASIDFFLVAEIFGVNITYLALLPANVVADEQKKEKRTLPTREAFIGEIGSILIYTSTISAVGGYDLNSQPDDSRQ